MNIRRAQPGDENLWLGAVAALTASDEQRDRSRVSRDDVAAALADTRCYLYVALSSSDPVGLLSAYRFPDVERGGQIVYLYDIEVRVDRRRTGAGRQLVAALLDQCRRDRVRWIWAGTDRDNAAARRTFEASGATLEGGAYVEYAWDLD